MPVSELTVCLIIDEAKRKKDVGGELVLKCSLLIRERSELYNINISSTIDL